MSIHAAAKSLHKHLFGRSDYSHEGDIGMGLDKLHVYIRAGKKRWPGPTPSHWEGLPIIWHFGVGQARAFGAQS